MLFEDEVPHADTVLKEVIIIPYQAIVLAPSRLQILGIGFAEQVLQEGAHDVWQQYHGVKLDLAGEDQRVEEDMMPGDVLGRKHSAAPESEFNQPCM